VPALAAIVQLSVEREDDSGGSAPISVRSEHIGAAAFSDKKRLQPSRP
jgi:hypothetical protein